MIEIIIIIFRLFFVFLNEKIMKNEKKI